jgi:hypothetical protein
MISRTTGQLRHKSWTQVAHLPLFCPSVGFRLAIVMNSKFVRLHSDRKTSMHTSATCKFVFDLEKFLAHELSHAPSKHRSISCQVSPLLPPAKCLPSGSNISLSTSVASSQARTFIGLGAYSGTLTTVRDWRRCRCRTLHRCVCVRVR